VSFSESSTLGLSGLSQMFLALLGLKPMPGCFYQGTWPHHMPAWGILVKLSVCEPTRGTAVPHHTRGSQHLFFLELFRSHPAPSVGAKPFQPRSSSIVSWNDRADLASGLPFQAFVFLWVHSLPPKRLPSLGGFLVEADPAF
jgi:hypothetical protein